MKITEEERKEIKRKIDSDLDKLRLPLLREVSQDRIDYLLSLTAKERLDVIIDNMFPTKNMVNKHSTSNAIYITHNEIEELSKAKPLSLSQINLIRNKLRHYYSRNLPKGFKAIPGHPNNAVNKDGIVIVVRTRRILKADVDKKGYLRAKLDGVNKYIHRLVMLTFVGYSDLPVDHINNISYDNRITNLEYVTTKENNRRAIAMGLVS